MEFQTYFSEPLCHVYLCSIIQYANLQHTHPVRSCFRILNNVPYMHKAFRASVLNQLWFRIYLNWKTLIWLIWYFLNTMYYVYELRSMFNKRSNVIEGAGIHIFLNEGAGIRISLSILNIFNLYKITYVLFQFKK